MGSNTLSEVERMNKVLMDEYKIHRRFIRLATMELQTYLKQRATQLCKTLESRYNEKCQRLKTVMTSSGNYEEMSNKDKQDLYLTVFEDFAFDIGHCKEAIDRLNVDVAPTRSYVPKISLSAPSFEQDAEVEVIVQSRITRAGVFWITLPSTSKFDLAYLSKHISFLKMISGNWKSYGELGVLPALGEQVFLESSFGWLRGQVEKQRDQNTLSVRLLDYGRLIECRPDVLYPHKDDLFSENNFQALACCLLLDTNPFNIPIESVWAFNDILDENPLNSRSVKCRFKSKLPGQNGEVWQVDLLAKDKRGEAVSLSDVVKRKIEDKASGRNSIACRDFRYSDEECSRLRHIERPKEDNRVTAPTEPDSNSAAKFKVHEMAVKRPSIKHKDEVQLPQMDKSIKELRHADVDSSAENVLPAMLSNIDFCRPPPILAETENETAYRTEAKRNRYLEHSELGNSDGLSACGSKFDIALSSVDNQSASGAPLTDLERLPVSLNRQVSVSGFLSSTSSVQHFNSTSVLHNSLAAAAAAAASLQLCLQPALVPANPSLDFRCAQNMNSPQLTASQVNARLAAAHQLIASQLKLPPSPPPPSAVNVLFANMSLPDPHEANIFQSFEPQRFGLTKGRTAASSASADGFADHSRQSYYPQMSVNYPVNEDNSHAMRLPFANPRPPGMYPSSEFSKYPRFETENDEIDFRSIPIMTFSNQRSTESCGSSLLSNDDCVDASINSAYSDSGNRTASCKTLDSEPYESDGKPSAVGFYPPVLRSKEAEGRMDQHSRCAKLLHPSSSDPSVLSRVLAKNLQCALSTVTRLLLPEEMTLGDQTVCLVEASDKVPPPASSQLVAQLVGSSGVKAVYTESKEPEQSEHGSTAEQGSRQQRKRHWSQKSEGQSWQRPKECKRLTKSPHGNSSSASSDLLSYAAQKGARPGGQHWKWKREQKQKLKQEISKCYRCGQVGHYRKYCNQPRQKGKKGDAKQTNSKK